MTASASRAILVTGCSSGIGRATALALAARGDVVYASARRPDSITDLAAAGCRPLSLDVTSEDSMRAAVETVASEHGAVGTLVNNAGYSQSGAVETVAIDDVRRQFDTNVFGLVRMCQLVLPGMRAQRSGTIVNVSSMGGTLTFPGGGLYHATKHAVEAISDALRFEVAGFGVRVVVVQPGLIRTRFAEAATATIAAGDVGPYAAFNRAVREGMGSVYERGMIARLGGSPETVAAAIAAAIASDRPPTRVKVTPSARLFMAARALLPDAAWDRVMATRYPRPGD